MRQVLDLAIAKIAEFGEFWNTIVPGVAEDYNQSLERAGALPTIESGGVDVRRCAPSQRIRWVPFPREEYQTPDGEALRNDDPALDVAAGEFRGVGIFGASERPSYRMSTPARGATVTMASTFVL